ncbi:MAG: hypothetical protein IH598_04290 [Bacteroidales bacterium]|nr:hypothetical protein [Bacteroidales bacterium]
MTTIILDTRSSEARKILELLKKKRYARVLDNKSPNEETLKAIQEVEEGKVKSYASVDELMAILKTSSGV